MKFCIYSGTFNPIHIAHLIIAHIVKDNIGIDKILLIPAYDPPHKNIDIATANHRMNMLKLAVSDNNDFIVSDIEYRRKGKSYTYLTVKEIVESDKTIEGKIYFIIGTDAFIHIESWYEIQKLSELVKFVVIPRENNFESKHKQFLKKIKLKNIDFIITKVPLMDISSSFIRNQLAEGKSIKYLVPEKVEKYIYDNKLFV